MLHWIIYRFRHDMFNKERETVETGEGWVNLLELQGKVHMLQDKNPDFAYWALVRID